MRLLLPRRLNPGRGEIEFRRLLEKLPAAYTGDCDGLIKYFNSRAVQLWGREPKLNDPVDRFCGSFRLFSADNALICHDECWMALTLRENKEYNGHEIIVERPDGARLTVLAYANPLQDDQGELVGAVNVLMDITLVLWHGLPTMSPAQFVCLLFSYNNEQHYWKSANTVARTVELVRLA